MARDQDKKSVIFIQFRSSGRCRLCLVAAAPVYGWQQAHNRSNVNVTYMRDKPFNARLRRDLELITEEWIPEGMGDHDVIANFNSEHKVSLSVLPIAYAVAKRSRIGEYRTITRRQVAKFRLAADEGVEAPVGKQRECLFEPPPVGPAHPSIGRHLTDLRGDEAETAAVKISPQRDADIGAAIPARLDNPGLHTSRTERGCQARSTGTGVNDDICLGRTVLGHSK